MKKKLKPITEDTFQLELEAFTQTVIDFIQRIPDTPEARHMKSKAAEIIASEAINWGSYNHYEAIGIMEECKLRYRENVAEMLLEEHMQEIEKEDANFFTQVMMMSAGGGEA
jgi:hypothetical protein